MFFLSLWTWSLYCCLLLTGYLILNTKGLFCHKYITWTLALGGQYPSSFHLVTQTYLTIHEKVWPCAKSTLPDKGINEFWGWKALSAPTQLVLQQGLGEPCQQFVWPSPFRCDYTSSAYLQEGNIRTRYGYIYNQKLSHQKLPRTQADRNGTSKRVCWYEMKSGSVKAPGDKALSHDTEEVTAEHLNLSGLRISSVLEYCSCMEMLNTRFLYS